MKNEKALVTFMQQSRGGRFSFGDTWLIVSGETVSVYQRKYGARKTITLYQGEDMAEAIEALKSPGGLENET